MSDMYTAEQVQAVIQQALAKQRTKDFWGAPLVGLKHDPASTVIDSRPFHDVSPTGDGTVGLFAVPGTRPDMFMTLARPMTAARLLGLEKSVYTMERLSTITGVTDPASCTNADGWCGNPPDYGYIKGCDIVVNWGDFYAKTHLVALPDTGGLYDRSDIPRWVNNRGGDMGNPFIPDIVYQFPADSQSVLQQELFIFGVGFERAFEDVLINGLITNTGASANCGWMREFDGISRWIRTGYTDYYNSNLLCTALDSIVVNFNTDIGGTVSDEGTGRYITDVLSDTMWSLESRADTYFMGGVSFAFIMRKDLFRVLTHHLACNYATSRCTNTNISTSINIGGNDYRDLQLSMQRGQYLLIEGNQYPVVFSDGLTRSAIDDHVYESDILIVPLTWNGMKLLYAEYFPMDNQYLNEFATYTDGDATKVINNGMYLVTRRDNGNCVEYLFSARMRAILRTPHLAARIDNVQYEFRSEPRDAMTGDSYYKDGGTYKRLPWDSWVANGQAGLRG